ncbi:hypothetical protein I3F60_27335 [Streptomyces sp. MUM 136J]|uniref:DUF7878 domain-containing protein n=1 Tax=Streptomyces sp. MUM 136J TaxID=2791992 RepID=UPI001F0339C1|nr:hypothetical protein [Streptomyces sp. MUM 136J]MCH0572911.1 hypothetical protein [Streptomyces sp. MUM 136J]
MIFSYSNFTTQDLRGTSTEQLYTNIEADLRVTDGDVLIYDEVLFPVAELASKLMDWICEPESERPDFVFDSMSFAEVGVISITRASGGWQIGSILSPGVHSSVLGEPTLAQEIHQLVADVRHDVAAAGIDPAFLVEEGRA